MIRANMPVIVILLALLASILAAQELGTGIFAASQLRESLLAGTNNSFANHHNNNTLALIYVVESLSEDLNGHSTALACSIQSVNRNIAPYSSVQMYIWTRSAVSNIPAWLVAYPNVTVFHIPDDEWDLPTAHGSPSQWVLGQHTEHSVYLTSRWRLTHAFEFARASGHRYILHIESYAVVTEAFTVNIPATLDEHQRLLGYRNRVLQEDATVALGLIELARFWTTIRNVNTPEGPILSAVKATAISGLTTSAWNRHIFPSSFLVVSLDFWFRFEVQDFLKLVLNTGCDLTQRWLDRDVFNIIALLFLPETSRIKFPGTSVLDQRLQLASDYHTILQCPVLPRIGLLELEDNGTSTDRIGTGVAATEQNGVNSIVFLVGWEASVILVVEGAQPVQEVVTFRWHYNTSSYGRDTATLNNYTGILDRFMSQPVDVDWWEAHNISHKLQRLLAKPVLPIDPTSLDGEEILEILQEQLDAYVDFFCANSVFVQSGARLTSYCDMIRRQAQGILSAQTTALLLET